MSVDNYSFFSEFNSLHSGYRMGVRSTLEKLLKVFFETSWIVSESIGLLSRCEQPIFARTEANVREFLSSTQERCQDFMNGVQRASEKLLVLSMLETGQQTQLSYFKSPDFFSDINLKEIYSIAKGLSLTPKDVSSFNIASSSAKSYVGHLDEAKAGTKLDMSHAEALENYNVRTLSLYHSDQEYGNILEKEFLIKDSLETVKNTRPDDDHIPNNSDTFDNRETYLRPTPPVFHLLAPNSSFYSLESSFELQLPVQPTTAFKASSMSDLTDLSAKRGSNRDITQNSSRNTPQKQGSQRNLLPIVEPINLLAQDLKAKPSTGNKQTQERTDYFKFKNLEPSPVAYSKYIYEEYNKHKETTNLDRLHNQPPLPANPAKLGNQWLETKKPFVDATPVRSTRESYHAQPIYQQQAPEQSMQRQTKEAPASPNPSYLRSSSHQQLPTPPRRDERVTTAHIRTATSSLHTSLATASTKRTS
jgi:hypothetical protein